MKIDQQDITRAFNRLKRRSLSVHELMNALRLPPGAKRAFRIKLRELERRGVLRRIRGGRYVLAENRPAAEGVVRLGKRGDGWIETSDGKSVRVAAKNLAGALDGDRVRYVALRRDRMNRVNGRVIEITERTEKVVVGQYQPGREEDFILPVDNTFQQPLPVTNDTGQQPHPGDWVAVRLAAQAGRAGHRRGELLEVLGNPSDPRVEMMASASRCSIPLQFPDTVLQAAADIPDRIAEAELAGRTDLRHLPFVTIDGATARDFDDAVALVPEDNLSRLYVAIADVSHYVPAGSVIDRAAQERGTSVYFPGFCLPMLPEQLSNELCSLKPDVDRLVLVAELVFDRTGQRRTADFYPAVITSKARLTYAEVQSLLDGGTIAADSAADPALVQLLPMLELSQLLTAQRMQRGSFELDIPEPEISLDSEGYPEVVALARRFDAHRIIEEFMLAANEAVADFLTGQKRDLPYRIHEAPDQSDFTVLNNFLAALGRKPVGRAGESHGELQQLLHGIEDASEKRIVSRLVLQSMKQARYSVDNVGHYGLAAERYCHFTSPIRRYPDLLVHRVLKQCLAGDKPFYQRDALEHLAEHSSQRERLAIDAERDVQALLICRFMQDKVGADYRGTIASVQKFGFFVELRDFPVEGLVHVASLENDYYHFDPDLNRLVGERTGQIFAVGKPVKISVENVNISRREIDFRLITDRSGQPAGDVRRRGRRKKRWR